MFEGMDQGEMGRLFQEFCAERMGRSKPPFRDLWVQYEKYGTTPTDGGRLRIKSWPDSQRFHQKRLLEYFGDMPYDQVSLAKAEEYRGWRRGHVVRVTKRAPKAATLNRELRSAQGCLSHAVRLGLIPRNPLAKMQDEKPIHDRDFSITQEQFLAIVEHARPLLRFYLVLLYETGMRASELRELPWCEVNIEGGFITLPWERTKGKREREIPLSASARLVLEMIPHDGVNPFVFASQYSDEPICMSEGTTKKWFREAREKAGVKGPKGQEVWLHTLRHTWATDMATTGMDISTLMNIAGWADKKMADKYINVARRHRESAKPQMDERSIAITRSLHTGKFGARKVPLRVVRKKEEGGGGVEE